MIAFLYAFVRMLSFNIY